MLVSLHPRAGNHHAFQPPARVDNAAVDIVQGAVSALVQRAGYRSSPVDADRDIASRLSGVPTR